jgi:hypothetical protein
LLLLTIAAYLALMAAMVGATVAAARLAAHWLDVPDFRWFDSQPAQAAPWRCLGVRLASALASLGLCGALFWLSYFFAGEPEPTTTVTVSAGPARDAGMRDGDRVVSVNGVTADNWEAVRKSITRGVPNRIEIERAGARSTLVVTPNAGGRIAISPVNRDRSLGALESVRRAVTQPFVIMAAELRSVTTDLTGKPELTGPVGIVRETSKTPGIHSTQLLGFMATLGSYYWPHLLLLQLFDALTLPLFLATHPLARAGERSLWRVARVQQALMLALGCMVLMLALLTLNSLETAEPVVLPLLFLLLPVALSSVPLVWIAGAQFWGLRRTAAVVVPGILLPCITPVAAVALLLRARTELRQRGFRVGLLVATPQSEG